VGIFSVIWMVVKQIVNNWRLELSLVTGLIVAVAVFSSIPIYTEGSLQFALMEYWEGRSSPQRPPGALMISHDEGREQESTFEQFQKLDAFLKKEVPKRYGTEMKHFSQLGGLEIKKIEPLDPSEGTAEKRYADIRYLTGLREKVDLVVGRWPQEEIGEDDTLEVVVDSEARDYMDIMVGRAYLYPLRVEEKETPRYLKLKVVGAFRAKEELYNEPVWLYWPPFKKNFFVSRPVFEQLVQRDDTELDQYVWYWVFDHAAVRVHELPELLQNLNYIETRVAQILENTRFWISPNNIFRYFIDRAEILRKLLFILSLPVMGMVLYYIILAAGLTIRRRRNEIAMLRSRGAGIIQILLAYAIEWGILCLIAIAAGPYVGLMISKVMGAAAGFLSFVGRRPLPVIISPNAYRFALGAIGVALVSCLVPVIPAARHSIVTYKQDIARSSTLPVWQRYYLDLIFLGFSIYGYKNLQNQIAGMQEGAASGGSGLLLDPMLFLVPVLVLATAGLVSLRILPWIIRLLGFIANRLPGVCWVMTLRQLSRDPGQYSPLMFFLILTVSLGIYGASTARTLDQNFIDSLMYRYGGDVVLQERWYLPGAGAAPMMGAGMFGGGGPPEPAQEEQIEIFEPPFYIHKLLPGVEDAARVLKKEVRFSIGGNYAGRGTLVAIDPVDFAHVSWFRRDLAPLHLNEYMNRLITYPEGALVSRKFFQENNLELGDWVTIEVGRQGIDFFLAGVVDLWPTVYPDEFPLIVGNLDYVQAKYIIEPYNVWLRLKPDATLAPIVESLREKGVWVVGVEDTRTKLIEGRRAPQRMGLFGMLSIGFVVAVLITVIGFFLYTFLSLRSRMLQFGVLRAIGLSVPQLIAMLTLEQLLSVGIAFVLGAVFGVFASRAFLPFMQISQNISGVVPDFLVVVQKGDVLKILTVLGGTLLVGLVGLGVALSRMRLHQAIKLGEEV